jgi:uncharacterized delta-60 repeat protein
MRSLWIISAILHTLASTTVLAEGAPARLWVQAWNSTANHEDIGRLLALDSPDRIYVAGSSYEPGIGGAGHDYLLLQYDAAGNLAWARRYGDTGGDMVSDLAVPATGEVVLTGISTTQAGNDVATVKYDQAGNLLWDRRFPVQGIQTDDGPQLSIDGDRNIVISATTSGDYLVLKYAPDGILLWSRTHDGADNGDDVATDVVTDSDGSIYVTGTANSSSAFMTVKYSASGVLQWEQLEPGDIGSVFAPSHVAVGPDHDVVIAGSPESTCGVFQFKVWKCTASTGDVLWSDKAPSQPCSSFIFRDLVLDWAGNVLAVCSGSEIGVDTHMQVLRYTPDGVRQWVREFDGPGTAEDVAGAMATDAAGAAYVAGYTIFPPQNRDYAAAKFSADGVQQWAVTWASEQGTNDIGQDVVVDSAGNVILTGNSYSPVTNEDVVTIRYHQASAAAAPEMDGAGGSRIRLSAAPNPMGPEIGIQYEIPREGRVRLTVLSPGGRVVRTLVDEMRSTGSHGIRWNGTDARGHRLPEGTYIIALQAGADRASAKISLLR